MPESEIRINEAYQHYSPPVRLAQFLALC